MARWLTGSPYDTCMHLVLTLLHSQGGEQVNLKIVERPASLSNHHLPPPSPSVWAVRSPSPAFPSNWVSTRCPFSGRSNHSAIQALLAALAWYCYYCWSAAGEPRWHADMTLGIRDTHTPIFTVHGKGERKSWWPIVRSGRRRGESREARRESFAPYPTCLYSVQVSRRASAGSSWPGLSLAALACVALPALPLPFSHPLPPPLRASPANLQLASSSARLAAAGRAS